MRGILGNHRNFLVEVIGGVEMQRDHELRKGSKINIETARKELLVLGGAL